MRILCREGEPDARISHHPTPHGGRLGLVLVRGAKIAIQDGYLGLDLGIRNVLGRSVVYHVNDNRNGGDTHSEGFP